ncbi:MAG: hypothetical protein ABMB14_39410 [Myxococcota bacterium]
MWVVVAALADPPPPAEAAAPAEVVAPAPSDAPAGDEAIEITVWGQAVEQARDEVVHQIVGLGYDRQRHRDGRIVFIQERGWKGKVVLWDDGRLATRRRGPSFQELAPIAGTRFRPYPLCVIAPTACIDGGSFSLSERKWRGIEDQVARATADELGTLADRIADAAVADTLDALPVRLERLWADGTPLERDAAPLATSSGGPTLATFQARRAALLAFWDSRTETAWGQQVRDAVAGFVRAVVEASDHPFTAAERSAFDAARRSAAPFPWPVVGGPHPGRSESGDVDIE